MEHDASDRRADRPVEVATDRPPDLATRRPWVVPGLVILLSYLVTSVWIRPQEVGNALQIDYSWKLVLAQAAVNGWQAGRDYLFTYGPLGWVTSGGFHPDLYGLTLALMASVTFAAALLSVGAAFSLRRPVLVGTCLVLMLLARNQGPFYLGVFAAAIVLFTGRRSTRWRWLVPVFLFLAVVSLTKLPLLVLAVVVVMSVAVVAWLRSGSLRTALLIPGGFALIWCVVWLLAGQSLLDIPTWLLGSLQIISGYAEAMGSGGRFQPQIWLSLLVLPLWCTSLLLAPRRGRRPTECLLLVGLAFVFAYLMWKGAYVRCGSASRLWLFCEWLPAAMLLTWVTEDGWPRKKVVRTVLMATAIVLLLVLPFSVVKKPFARITGTGRMFTWAVTRPLWRITTCRTLTKRIACQSKVIALPAIRTYVGDEPVDLLNDNRQGLVVLNRFTYRPRPVFQSYSAYTRPLLETNARHFQGDSAPRYVLLRINSLDSRYPTLDDSLALLEVLRSYRPVMCEKQYVLLENQGPAPSWTSAEPFLRRELRWGERLDLRPYQDRIINASIDLQPTLLGRLMAALYKPPRVAMLVVCGGKAQVYQIVPRISRCGFLLQPRLATFTHLRQFLVGGKQNPRRTEMLIDSLSVDLKDTRLRRCYQNRIVVELTEIPPDELRSLEAGRSWLESELGR